MVRWILSRRLTSVALLAALSIAGSGLTQAVTPSGSWSAPDPVGPRYSFNFGGGLARSVSGTAEYLHLQYTTDNLNGVPVNDAGPFMGVYYTRFHVAPETSSAPFRLNPSTQHGSRGGVAAAGVNVYTSYITFVSEDDYQPTDPRVLYFRRNRNHGQNGYWNAARRITSTTGRVDYPTIAATGTHVYIAYTDSATGAVNVAISHDRGATWSIRKVGTTTRLRSDGKAGAPTVAAAGSRVAVTWLADGRGAVQARISNDAGTTWPASTLLVGSSLDISHAHALGDRVGFVWLTANGVRSRIWQAGVWLPAKTVSPFSATGTYKSGYGPAIALTGTGGVGVSWGDCRLSGCITSTTAGVDLSWRESIDNGATWNAKRVLSDSTTGTVRRFDWPSVVWADSSRRFVLYNAATHGYSSYRLYLRAGQNAGTSAGAGAQGATDSDAGSDSILHADATAGAGHAGGARVDRERRTGR